MEKLFKLRKINIISQFICLFTSLIFTIGEYTNVINKNIDKDHQIIITIFYLIITIIIFVSIILYILNSNKSSINRKLAAFLIVILLILNTILIYNAYICVFGDCLLISIITFVLINVIFSRVEIE